MRKMTLEDARKALDRMDADIVRVFLDRMRVSGEVGEIKAGTGQPVFAPDRENAILDKIQELARSSLLPGERQEPATHLRSLMRHVMQVSREFQYDILMPKNDSWKLGRLIADAPQTLPDARTIAVQGGAGSYQSMAASRLFPDAVQIETETFIDSCAMAQDGRADVAVLPLENTTAGTVDAVYDLLLRDRKSVV